MTGAVPRQPGGRVARRQARKKRKRRRLRLIAVSSLTSSGAGTYGYYLAEGHFARDLSRAGLAGGIATATGLALLCGLVVAVVAKMTSVWQARKASQVQIEQMQSIGQVLICQQRQAGDAMIEKAVTFDQAKEAFDKVSRAHQQAVSARLATSALLAGDWPGQVSARPGAGTAR